MAISYPASLDAFTNPAPTDKTNVVSHVGQHANANDAIEALEAKVGADASAVTTSHDYKLSAVTGADKAASMTDLAASVTGLLDLKGDTDASANPNYPVALKGDAYYITVAGKIGGASGKSVDIGDTIVAKADNAGGDEASVGTSWFVLEHNLAGSLVTANNLSELTATASTARTNLGLGTLATQSGTFSGTSSGTNTGDQASIVGITGSLAQFNTALTGADFASGGGTATGTNTGDQTTVSGNAGTATALQTARAINGVNFDGTAPITVTAAAGTLTGTTLNATVVTSSIASTGTLTSGATGAGFTVAFSTSTLTGTVPHARLGTGGGGATKFLREDSTWQTLAAGGDVVGPASAVNNRVVFFDTTTGKLIKDSGLTLAGTNTGDQTTVSGNAGTATALATARAINGVNFDGTAAITVTAAAGTLTGATLAAGVTASSLTSVGTLGSLTVTNDVTAVSGKFLGKGTVRNEVDYTTLEASTPAYTGQLAITPDGRYFFVSRGTGAGNWTRLMSVADRTGENFPMNFTSGNTFFSDAQINMNACQLLVLTGALQAGGNTVQSVPHIFAIHAGAYVDNVINLQNLNSTSHSGISMLRSGDASPGVGSLAVGGENGSVAYGNRLFLATNSAVGFPNIPPIPITLSMDAALDGTTLAHYRINCDGAGQWIKLYGWSPTLIEGPVGVYVGPDGRVGLGTDILATGAQVTIKGAIALGGTATYSESNATTSAPVGYGVVGISSTGILRRFEVGVQVGGSASNPGEPVSRVGTAADLKSADAIGVRVSDAASGIVSPTITNAGSGYHTPPLVTAGAAPSGGITALVTAYLTETSLHQTAAQITALTGGTGYTASEVVTVTFAAPSNTTGRAGRGTLTANGSGVIAAATSVVFGTAGTGTAVTNAAGVITAVALSVGGSAFPKSQTSMPVSLVASGNRTAGGLADTNSSGVLTSVTLNGGGTGYTPSQGALAITIDAFGSKYGSLPTVTVTPPVAGITPRVVAKVNPTTIAQILVSDPGDKYTAGGSFSFNDTGTGGASGAATYSVVAPITGRGVYEYRMLTFGAGYNPNSPPAITVVAPPSGTTATGTATVNSRGQVTNITAVIPGGAYGLVPGVTVAAPAPVTATGTATQSGGAINSVTITQGGSGYFAAFPAITVGGTGTLGTAVVTAVTGGVVTAIQVTNGGSGYTGTPTITFAAPAAGTTATAAAVLGGRSHQVEPDGGEVLFETQLRANYINEICGGSDWKFSHLRGANTLDQQGIAAPTSVPAAPTSVIDTDGDWLHYASAATINLVSGAVAASFTITRRDFLPVFIAYIKTGAAITNSRNWVGWNSAILTAKDVPTTEHVAAFRYASVTDTTAFWRCITAAGSTPTTIVTPFPIAANTAYELIVDMSTANTCRFYINGQLAATIDTTLPTGSTPLGWTAAVTNVTGTAHEMKIAHIRGKQRS